MLIPRDFLCLGRSFGGSTIYSNVCELQGGQILTYEPINGIKIKNYWKPFEKKISKNISLNKNSLNFKKKFIKVNNL